MSRLLFAWELGANLGHLSRDLVLARACRDAGHQIIMAVANLCAAFTMLGQEGFTLVQAPVIRPSIKRNHPPLNYADMLLHEGYDDIASLVAALKGWDGLIELAKPDLLIYNHAPTALIAARVRNLPVMIIGTGFEIPPDIVPLPSFRPWQDIPQAVLQHAEEQVLMHINPQFLKNGQAVLTNLAALFATKDVQLTTFQELDPFGKRTGCEYIGSLYAMPVAPASPAVDWHTAGQHIFAYLRLSMPSCEHVLAALQMLNAEVICVVPEISPEWILRYDRLRIFAYPIELAPLLSTADLVVTYGGGTIATALLAGVPVLLIPQVVEQYLAGLRLEKIEAGLMLGEQPSIEQCTKAIKTLLTTPSYRQAANAFAKRHSSFSIHKACQKFLALVELKTS